jgi:hypothetical protein
MAREDLLNIRLTDKSKDLIKRLSKLGLKQEIETVAQNAVKGTTELGLKAFKSKVPIDTKELRNIFITSTFRTKSIEGDVYIAPGLHIGRDGKEVEADFLALFLLDKGPYHRSRTSDAISPFSSEPKGAAHQGWVLKSENALKRHLADYLRSTDFSNGF